MSFPRQRPRPLIVSHGPRKKFNNYESQPNVGNLSPDLQPNTPPVFQKPSSQNVFKIGKYLLVEQSEGNEIYKAVNLTSGDESVCKVCTIYLLLQYYPVSISSSRVIYMLLELFT